MTQFRAGMYLLRNIACTNSWDDKMLLLHKYSWIGNLYNGNEDNKVET